MRRILVWMQASDQLVELGIQLFHDVGRVWVPEEKSGRWHNGYGGGIYIAPIRRWVVSASVATSKEEKILPYFSLGFRF